MGLINPYVCSSVIFILATSICANNKLNVHLARARNAAARSANCAGCTCMEGESYCEMPGSSCECYGGAVYYKMSVFCPVNVSDCAIGKGGQSPPDPSCLQCGCWEGNCVSGKCHCKEGVLYSTDNNDVCIKDYTECIFDESGRSPKSKRFRNCARCYCSTGERWCFKYDGRCNCDNGILYPINGTQCVARKRECEEPSRVIKNKVCLLCECSGSDCEIGNCQCKEGIIYHKGPQMKCAHSRWECLKTNG